MKILVFSDSHGNLQRIKHVIGFAEKINSDAIIHCGDWDDEDSVVEISKALIPVYGVLGNADYNPQVEQRLKDLKIIYHQDVLKINIGGKKIVVCHFPDRLIQEIEKETFDIAFHGHTHRQKEEIYNGTKIVNPGALQSLKPSFAVYDLDANAVEFIDVEI